MTAQLKRCGRCKEAKPVEQFSSDAARRDGLEYRCKACVAAYRAANKDAIAARGGAYRAAHKDATAARNAAYWAANKDALAARNAAYRAANRDALAAQKAAYRTANREAIAARKATYYAANKEAIAARKAAWDARRNAEALVTGICAYSGCDTSWRAEAGNAGPTCWEHAPAWIRGYKPFLSDAQLVAKAFGYSPNMCVYCGAKANHGDHIAPKSRYPQLRNSMGNLVPACRACNRDKGARTLAEWAPVLPPDAAIIVALANLGYDQPPGTIPIEWRDRILAAGGVGVPDIVYATKVGSINDDNSCTG